MNQDQKREPYLFEKTKRTATEEDNFQQWRTSLEKVAVQHVELSPQSIGNLSTFVDDLLSRHHLAGLVTDGLEPVVLFRLPENAPADIANQELRVWPWSWSGRFGACLTLSAQFLGTRVVCRAVVPQDSAALDAISTGKILAVFLRGRRVVSAYRIDFSANEEFYSGLLSHVDTVRRHKATLFHDCAVHYWDILDCQAIFADRLTVADRLSLGWYKCFEESAWVVQNWLSDIHQRPQFLSDGSIKMPGCLREFLHKIKDQQCDAKGILDYLGARYDSDLHEFAALICDWLSIDPHANAEWEEFFCLTGTILRLYNRLPTVTDCGRRLQWFDFSKREVRRLDLEPRCFPISCKPEDFWRLLPTDPIGYGYGIALSGCDFPIDSQCLVQSISTLPQAEDAAKVSASADALFEEAMASKRGTIPYKANVQLRFGPFTHVEVTEIKSDVLFACRTTDNRFCLVIVEPWKNYCSFSMPEDAGLPEDQREKLEAGIKLLFAAIVRDFWVIENRESVFDCRIVKDTGPRIRKAEDSRRVVYIPRVKYSPKADVEKCIESLDHTERRAHFVKAHLRKVKTPSKYQLILAHRYGMDVPTGYTFIRPHERGKGKRDVVYRSRSALQCLYTVASATSGTQPSRWFQFERDVHRMMEAMGFVVEHIAASRHGDGGIDVYATKGRDFDQVSWVIQCKCWQPKRKIPPSIVRELIGTLTSYPQGTRGMIVTTSSFSSGAAETAHANSIRLVDGAEFYQLVKATGEQPR